MKPDDFQFITQMLKKQSGIIIGEDKLYLLETRLMPVARVNGKSSIEELIAALRGGDAELVKAVVEAMTTNETFFFRDSTPFTQFKEVVLPQLLETRAKTKKIRIWCAACSSGQEPYSLAMILDEVSAKMPGWNVEIIGTDLSLDILKKALVASYTQFEVQRGLPIQYLIKHFVKDGDTWALSDKIKSKVTFKQLNLLNDFTSLGTFDVVFCRNVLIYFDLETKRDILSRIAARMSPDACLFLGGAETVLGVSDAFLPVAGQRGVYKKKSVGEPKALSATEARSSITPPSINRPGVTSPSTTSSVARPATPPAIKRPVVGGSSTTGTQTAVRPTIGQSSVFNRPATGVQQPSRPVSPTTPPSTNSGSGAIVRKIIKRPIGTGVAPSVPDKK